MYKLTHTLRVTRLADGASLPADPANNDYAQYLRWIAAGNTPEPADVPDPKQVAQGKISALEAQNMLPRVVREYLLTDFTDKAVKAGLDPMLLPAYAKLKALDDKIKTLRAQL